MHRSTADFLFEGSRRAGNLKASVDIVARDYLRRCEHWQHAFASQHKDHRYYEIVADTLHPEFTYLFSRCGTTRVRFRPFSRSLFLTKTSWQERAHTSAVSLTSSGSDGLGSCS
jgi:hypothetical protein